MRTEPEIGPLSFGPRTADGKRWCRCGHAEHDGICGATSRVKTEGIFADKIIGHEPHEPCDCGGFEPVVYQACGGIWSPGWDMRAGRNLDGSRYKPFVVDLRKLEHRGYLNGYPVYIDWSFRGADGIDVLKLDIEHPLEGWLTGCDGWKRLREGGLLKNSPRDSIAAYDALQRSADST